MALDLPSHFLRLGSHAEKEYFLEHKDLYDGVIFNANLVSITTAACASLATALIDKPLLIDPWTFVYGLPHEFLLVEKEVDGKTTLEVKSSYMALSEEYGPAIRNRLADSDFTSPQNLKKKPSSSFLPDALLQSFADQVLEFQRTILQGEMEEDDYFGTGDEISPSALIAPYFFNDLREQGWLDLNLSLLDASLNSEQRGELPILPMLCLPNTLLRSNNRSELDSVLSEYLERECPGYLLWFDNFDEKSAEKASVDALQGLLHTIQTLRENGNAWVMNAYGGYFSVASLTADLSAFSHAVGYGEYKSVEPPSGGTPIAKYYFPPLHQRVDAPTAWLMVQVLFSDNNPEEGGVPSSSIDDILGRSPKELSVEERERTERFFNTICSCETCQDVVGRGIEGFQVFAEAEKSDKPNLPTWLKDRKYPTGRAKRKNNLHYLRVRRREVEEVKDMTPAAVSQRLRSDIEWFEDAFPHPPDDVRPDHLARWESALQ